MFEQITPINASNVVGEPKTEVYILLNMIHCMAATAANADKLNGWQLKSTSTYEDYVMTTWTNGIVDVMACTWKIDGTAVKHEYAMFKAIE